jgi:hypothetical protein
VFTGEEGVAAEILPFMTKTREETLTAGDLAAKQAAGGAMVGD